MRPGQHIQRWWPTIVRRHAEALGAGFEDSSRSQPHTGRMEEVDISKRVENGIAAASLVMISEGKMISDDSIAPPCRLSAVEAAAEETQGASPKRTVHKAIPFTLPGRRLRLMAVSSVVSSSWIEARLGIESSWHPEEARRFAVAPSKSIRLIPLSGLPHELLSARATWPSAAGMYRCYSNLFAALIAPTGKSRESPDARRASLSCKRNPHEVIERR